MKFQFLIKIASLFLLLVPIANSQPLKNIEEFKTKLNNLQRTGLSLHNGVVYIGEFISFTNEKNELVSVDLKSFDKLMSQFLTPEKYREFKEKFESKKIIGKEELESFGFQLILDLGNFKLDLRVNEMFLNPTSISLNTYTVDQNEINGRDASLSGYINYSFVDQFKKEEKAENKNSITGSLSSNLNGFKLNLENHHIYSEDNKFIRTTSRLTRDFEEQKLRLSLGDHYYSPRVFQGGTQYLGMKIKKEFELTPFSISTTRGEREIYLETPSVVEIFINGQLIQTLNLEAGKHKIEDIPTISGINHIILRISDNKGNKQIIDFSQTSSDQMLKPGVHDFEYNLGSLSNSTEMGINYTEKIALSGYHKYGVTNNWTTSLGAQLKSNFYNLGSENQIATNRGIWVHNLTYSEGRNKKKGIANRIAYFWTCPCGKDQVKRLVVAYDFQSPNFLTNIFSETYSERNLRHLLSLNYNQKLTDTISGSLGFGLASANFKKPSSEQASIGLSKKFINDILLSMNAQFTRTPLAFIKNNISLVAQVTYSFDGGKKNLALTSNKTSAYLSNQVEYSYNKSVAMNNNVFRARAFDQDGTKAYSSSYYLNGSKFELLAGLDYYQMNKVQIYSLNPSGSIAFADNSFSFGQRIQNSFVIISNEQKNPVVVNGDPDNNESYIKPLSSALLTSVQPYIPKSINVISDDNKIIQPFNKSYKIQTTYKAGSRLKLGGELLKMAQGVLVNEEGIPYSFAGGKLVNLSNGKEDSFFTGKNGKFYLENISSDSYQLLIFDKQQVRVFNLNLKDKLKDEINDLGKLIIK